MPVVHTPPLRAPLNRPYAPHNNTYARNSHNDVHGSGNNGVYDVNEEGYMNVEYDEEDEILARAIQASLNEEYY